MKLLIFIKYIESLGFKPISSHLDVIFSKGKITIFIDRFGDSYTLNEIYDTKYGIDFEDLEPINIYFKKELRSIKLNKLLN